MNRFIPSPPPKNRIYGLDILRALAIIFVVYGHAQKFAPEWLKDVYTIPLYDGVAVFFVLSGFLRKTVRPDAQKHVEFLDSKMVQDLAELFFVSVSHCRYL